MADAKTPEDPKGLVFEAYRIEGITAGECRSIFLDWALSIPMGSDQVALVTTLLARYADQPDHPMTAVLREGAEAAPAQGRRGGRAARMARKS